MPLYDYACPVCDNRLNDILIQNPTKQILETTRYRPCSCGATMEREFPLPRRPHVDYTNPEMDWRLGAKITSLKHYDQLEKKLKEPNIDQYARQHTQQEAVAQSIQMKEPKDA